MFFFFILFLFNDFIYIFYLMILYILQSIFISILVIHAVSINFLKYKTIPYLNIPLNWLWRKESRQVYKYYYILIRSIAKYCRIWICDCVIMQRFPSEMM